MIHRCVICCKDNAVIRFRLLEMCFDCALDSIEPINPEWGIAIEINKEGYFSEKYKDGEISDYMDRMSKELIE